MSVSVTLTFASAAEAAAALAKLATTGTESPQPAGAAAPKAVKPASEPRTATAGPAQAAAPAQKAEPVFTYAQLQASVLKRLPEVQAAGRMADFLALAGAAKAGASTFKDLSTPAELEAANKLVLAFDLAAPTVTAESVV